MAFSESSPVLEPTCSSLNFSCEFGSWLNSVPMIAPMNPSGMLRMPGFSRGNQAPRLWFLSCRAAEPESPLFGCFVYPERIN